MENGEYGELLIMAANGRWYLTRRLKGPFQMKTRQKSTSVKTNEEKRPKLRD